MQRADCRLIGSWTSVACTFPSVHERKCERAGLVGTAYTAVFIIASAAKAGLQGKAFYLGPNSLQNYFLGTNVSTSQKLHNPAHPSC